MGWLGRLLGRGGADGAWLLTLEREAQALRLRCDEQERQLTALRAEVERQQSGAAARAAEAVGAARERLLTDAAGPVAQLLTQAHLLEVENKPVQARDLLAVARRLLRLLEAEGLTVTGAVGERVAFDPDRHAPLSGETIPRGEKVTIRFVGIAHGGRVLRKAGVEREQE
jgi:molecular chaperone GrpE (heat shock protein)